jgi:hypothetical protein
MLLIVIFGPFVTAMLNGDPIQVGRTFLPGVGAHDAGAAAIAEAIDILPFVIARQYLRSAEDNAQILRIMVIAGLAYSIPVLFELRMSPQLNIWVYGYMPDSFLQEERGSGYRAIVFVGLGLTVAIFSMTTAVAAASLWRTRTSVGRFPLGAITAYLSLVVVLCKSLGSLVYCAAAVPLVRWGSPRLQVRVASVLVIVALAYPMLRATGLFPTTTMVEVARAVSQDRGNSLNLRFSQEDQLLAHALERPLFGWGRYGRNRLFNGWQGGSSSITDGFWIIILGVYGLAGFAATFGLIALPVFRAARALKFAETIREREHLAALAVINAVTMIDQLPNASFSNWNWLLVGALLGRAEQLRTARSQMVGLQHPRPLAGRLSS